MTALKVIGIILLIFILIGFLRVGALMQFGDELRVQLSVGPFRFTLLPAKEKKETVVKKTVAEIKDLVKQATAKKTSKIWPKQHQIKKRERNFPLFPLVSN